MDLVRFARSSEADLLHLEGATSFAFGRLGARAAGLPAVLHFHCMIPLPWPQSILNRRLISRSWQGIAVSEAVRRWSIQACGIAPESVEVLYSGHDIDRFAAPSAAARDHVRREFALDRRAPVVALVGRLDVAQKGQDAMIRAMATLRARFPDAVLLLVGDGPDRERCAALVRLLGLDEAVRFAGHRHDVAEILAAVDVAVVPSLCEEAFGFVALEASAAGRPVVAFASGGLPEVVLHGQTGIVVPKGDVAGLADAIAHVLDDPDLARRLGEGGRRQASRFGLAQHADQLMDLYDAVLDEHHQSRGRTSHAWRKQRTC
jgi:glycosyltransferase involved in cell wall biosynthesis